MFAIKTGTRYVGVWAHSEMAHNYAARMRARGMEAEVITLSRPDPLPALKTPRVRRSR